MLYSPKFRSISVAIDYVFQGDNLKCWAKLIALSFNILFLCMYCTAHMHTSRVENSAKGLTS
jgi:hypothetical protein